MRKLALPAAAALAVTAENAAEVAAAAQSTPWTTNDWSNWFTLMLGIDLPSSSAHFTTRPPISSGISAAQLNRPQTARSTLGRAPAVVDGPACKSPMDRPQRVQSARGPGTGAPASFLLTKQRREVYHRLLTGSAASTSAALALARTTGTSAAHADGQPPADWPAGPTQRPLKVDPSARQMREKRLDELASPSSRRWRASPRVVAAGSAGSSEAFSGGGKGCWCNRGLPQHNGSMYALRCRTAVTGAPTFCPWRFSRGRIAFGPQVCE